MARWRTHHKRAARNRWREVEIARAEMERLTQMVLREVTTNLVRHFVSETLKARVN